MPYHGSPVSQSKKHLKVNTKNSPHNILRWLKISVKLSNAVTKISTKRPATSRQERNRPYDFEFEWRFRELKHLQLRLESRVINF